MWFYIGHLTAVCLLVFSELWIVEKTHASSIEQGRAQDTRDNVQIESVNGFTTGSSHVSFFRTARAAPGYLKRSCSAPAQPENGEWRIQSDFCDESLVDCKVPQGTELGLGFQLVYTCRPGYKIEGNDLVFCRARGDWSFSPVCKEIRCEALNTVSRNAQCNYLHENVNCNLPVLPKTTAEVSCRPGYRRDTTVLSQRRNILTCDDHGEWYPTPLRCLPVCGQLSNHQKPFVVYGTEAKVTDFPWHATLYLERQVSGRPRKEFICGGTIIRANLVLTAAHCVYDEIFSVTIDPAKLFIMTGNIYRDYDDPLHDPKIVTRNAVKQVNTFFNFYGLRGNYASDIALLELVEPFVFSEILLPACLDTSGSNAPYLEAGAYGKVAGFGLTASGESSRILQTITVPYIAYGDCKISKNAAKNHIFITKDKFCAGYTNGSAVCEGDSGGGLVFEKNDHWYVMGIVSVGLGVDIENGERTCERYAYTLYTKVSDYNDWIFQVITSIEQRQLTTPKPDSPVSPTVVRTDRTTACSIPSEPPTNGEWPFDDELYKRLNCNDAASCRVPASFVLVFRCKSELGQKLDIPMHCNKDGTWTKGRECNEPKCSPLMEDSIVAKCYSQSGDLVNCEAPVPVETAAVISCREGHVMDIETKDNVMYCLPDGQWSAFPFTCSRAFYAACTEWSPENKTPLDLDEAEVKLGDTPWHASVYQELYKPRQGAVKHFRCGATLINFDFVITSARCVHNEITGTRIETEKLFVMMGTFFRDYDSPSHDSKLVRKRGVKSISLYYGFDRTLGPDLAALELIQPVQASSAIAPVCLGLGSSYVAEFLAGGVKGKLVGFGTSATGQPNNVLKAMTVSYVPGEECLKEFNASKTNEFCTTQSYESTICSADYGSGFVSLINKHWYLLGIVSGSHANYERGVCDKRSVIYTRFF